MKGNEAILVYYDNYRMIRAAMAGQPAEECLRLLDALLRYAETGEEPARMGEAPKTLFLAFRGKIDEMRARAAEKAARCREAGSRGGKAAHRGKRAGDPGGEAEAGESERTLDPEREPERMPAGEREAEQAPDPEAEAGGTEPTGGTLPDRPTYPILSNPIQSNPILSGSTSSVMPSRAADGDGAATTAAGKGRDAEAPGAGEFGARWMKSCGRAPTPFDRETFGKLASEFSRENVLLAIDRACLRGKVNWGYIRGILASWGPGGPDEEQKPDEGRVRYEIRNGREYEDGYEVLA